MHTLILTCAGRSTRFPDYRPKWALTHPNGNLMAAESIRGLTGFDRLVVVLREDHAGEYGVDNVIREFALAGFGAEVIAIPPTSSQADTVSAALARANVRGAFTVKDCDNTFSYELHDDNGIAVVDLHGCDAIVPGNKSYVRVEGGDATEIAEKRIISPLFCCGAYTFARPAVWENYCDGAGYVSEVIGAAMRAGNVFAAREAHRYVDWGTQEAWQAFRAEYMTLFVDVDGVLVRSSHRTFPPRWGESSVIEENVAFLNRLHDTGKVEIVLTTSRGEAYRGETREQLAGLRYDRLIMGLRACRRVLVNDIVSQRGERAAEAINIERNYPGLKHLFKSLHAGR